MPTLSQRLWSDVHTLEYRLADQEFAHDCVDRHLEDGATFDSEWTLRVASHEGKQLCERLTQEPAALSMDCGAATSSVRLLWTLLQLSRHHGYLFEADGILSAASPPPDQSTFFNCKLNAKLLRQLGDPLALCSRALPRWCDGLVLGCPFLFTFEARHLYLQSTAFGLARALQRLQQHTQDEATTANHVAQRDQLSSELRLGRLPRQKVRISRSRVMDSALKVMDLYACQSTLLEVEYFDEVGTGLGPTLEFYTLVSHELRRSELGIWADDGTPTLSADQTGEAGYVSSACGLYPKAIAHHAESGGVPARTLQIFTFMGKFIAKAMIDCRLVDLPFAPTFYRQMLGQELSIADVDELRPHLGRNLRRLRELARKRTLILESGGEPAQVAKQLDALQLDGCDVANLGLNFTLPGQPEMELKPGGSDIDVTLDNVGEYVQRCLDVLLVEGVHAQVSAFRAGFDQVVPIRTLAAFCPDELDTIINGSRERWEVQTIVEHLRFDHGYTRSSDAVCWLLQVMCEFSDAMRANFLKFVTGSPRVPVGGLASLTPRLTIVRKNPEEGVSPDAYLPSVMTCANYVKLPPYSSKDVLRARLVTAISEGQGAFYLS